MINFSSPFQHSLDHTNKVLFQPFSLNKWFALGFTAWLASFLSGGNSGGFNFPTDLFNSKHSNHAASSQDSFMPMLDKMTSLGLPFWLLILALFGLVICLITLVVIALGVRGQFMFLDNVIYNRNDVKKPWKEFSHQANELTVWYALYSVVSIVLVFTFFGAALTYFWPDILNHKLRAFTYYIPWLISLGILGLLSIPLSIFIFFLHEFGIPIMAKHRCSMIKTFSHLGHIFRIHFVDCLVYLLIRMGMGIAYVLAAMILGCLTCCIGFLPYLSTVMTLPYHVFRQTYALNCLAQFGDDYNLWPILPPPPPPSSMETSILV